MAGLHFDITGDNSNFLRKLEEARNGVRNTSKQIEESGLSIEQMFGRITSAAAAFGAGFTAKELIGSITRVRGEFQQLEVAFKTMLGSEEQANVLMSQLVNTAAKTPFDLQGVANGAKQLLAYGTSAEDVNGTLVRLGDIAAGLSIPLNDLVYLYGTTMTQGRLFTQDLHQFQGRGIPLADELAKQFGVAKDKVGELVTAGKVGFPEVQKAIEAMTNDGGKFGGLMEAQSKTITGQISNIEDAISTMFNKIGKENESTINSALSGVSYLVENWESVVVAIESAAVAYGTYKAAVMTTAALQGAEQTLKVDTEIEGLKALLAVKEESKNADIAAAVSSGKLTEAKAAELIMLREELATRLSVLKVKEEEAIAEQASALSVFNDAKQASDAANEKLEKMNALYEAALNQGDASYEQYAMEQLQTASANANTAATTLNTAERNLNTASVNRRAASEAVGTVATRANTIANHANTASMNIMKLAAIQLTTILKGMWATLMANPLLLVAGAVAGLGFALYKVATAESEAEKATRMYNEALDEQQKKQDEYKENIDKLIKAIGDNNKSEGERLQAFEALKAEYPTVLNNLLTEAEYLKDVLKYKKLIAEEDNNRAKKSDVEILEEEKRKLEYYQNVRKNGTSTSLVDMDGNGWASDNVEKAIKEQQAIVNKAISKVAGHNVTSYLGNIKDMKDGDIVSVINGIDTSLKALGKSGDDAIAIVTELGGEFSKSQLSSIKSALETEQKSRSGEKNTGKEWIEKYRKGYLDAKKNLDAFLNTESSLTEAEYERKLKELTDKKDEAEKKYKSVGGVTNTSKQESAAEKLRKQKESIREQNEKISEIERKQTIDRQRQQEDLQNQSVQAEIDAMTNGFEKIEKQRELDNKKEIQSLQRQKEDYIRAFIQAEEEKFDAKEELNAKNIKGYNRKTFDSSTVKVDTSVFDGVIGNTSKKQLNDKVRQQEDAWNEYLIKFGNYQQKRKAIIEKYDKEIREADSAGDAAMSEKNKQNALDDLDNSIKNSATLMGQLFADASQKSANEIQKVIEKAELLMRYLEAARDENGNAQIGGKTVSKQNILDLGVSNNTLQNLELSTEEIEALKNAIDKLKGDLGSKSPFKLFESQIKSAVDKLKLGGKKNIAQGIAEIGGAIASFSPAVSQFGKDLGNIFGSDDLGNKISGISDALGGVGQTAAGVGQIMSGDIVGGAMSAVSGISSVVDALDGLFGADYSHYNEMKEQYDVLNSVWDKLIDKKKEYINTSYGTEAYQIGKEAEELQNKAIESYRILGRERLNSGASAGSHSIGVRIRKGMSNEGWNEAKKALNDDAWFKEISTGRMESLFDLSVEQLDKLKSDAPTFWAKLDGDVREYLNNIIEGSEKLEEIQKQVKEQLTQVSFDSVFDSFVDTLMDMKANASDFSDDLSEMFMRSLLSNEIGTKYYDKLKGWYGKWSEAMKIENEVDRKLELDSLRKEYEGYVDSAIQERNDLANTVGYTGDSSSSQSSTSKGFQAMSQDTGTELNGRFTALQISNEEIKNSMLSMLVYVNIISVSVSNNSITLTEIKNLMISSNSYLEDISGHTKKMLETFGNKLDSINKNIEKAL